MESRAFREAAARLIEHYQELGHVAIPDEQYCAIAFTGTGFRIVPLAEAAGLGGREATLRRLQATGHHYIWTAYATTRGKLASRIPTGVAYVDGDFIALIVTPTRKKLLARLAGYWAYDRVAIAFFKPGIYDASTFSIDIEERRPGDPRSFQMEVQKRHSRRSNYLPRLDSEQAYEDLKFRRL